MASASSTSARSLFVDSKLRLADRVQVNVNNIASVARQIQRGAKSNENEEGFRRYFQKIPTSLEDNEFKYQVLMHAARNFALQEHAIENSESNLKKLQLISAHLGYQQESLLKSAILVEEVKEQVRAMQR